MQLLHGPITSCPVPQPPRFSHAGMGSGSLLRPPTSQLRTPATPRHAPAINPPSCTATSAFCTPSTASPSAHGRETLKPSARWDWISGSTSSCIPRASTRPISTPGSPSSLPCNGAQKTCSSACPATPSFARRWGKIPIPEHSALHAIYENELDRIAAEKTAEAATGRQTARLRTPARPAPPQPSLERAIMMDTEENTAESPRQWHADPSPAQTKNDQSNQMSMTAPAIERPPTHPRTSHSSTTFLALHQQRIARLAAMPQPEFDAFLKSFNPRSVPLAAGLTPDQNEFVAALENPQRVVIEELIAQRLTRDIYSNAQLQEVMTDFWLNHFNVYLHKNEETPYYLVSYERDVIRPLALGKFEDLLEATAHSPAMLLYLDNSSSMGPDSPAAERAKIEACAQSRREEKGARGTERKLCPRADGAAHPGRERRLYPGRRDPGGARPHRLDRRSPAARRRIQIRRQSP